MVVAEFATGPSLIVLGLAVVALVFVLRRSLLRTHRRDNHDRAMANRDDAAAEKGAVRATEMLEVRLHEFAREVEGRMQTRIGVLDRLIIDADREIARLKDRLAATNGDSPRARGAITVPDPATFIAGAGRQPDADVLLPGDAASDRRDAA